MGTNKEYWRKRFQELEEEQYQRSIAYYQDLQEQFRRAKNGMQMDLERWYQRLAENHGISLAAAKQLLKKNELEEFHWTVEEYIKKGEEHALDLNWRKQLENASVRHHISYLEAMKWQIQQHAELLFTEYEGGVTDFLHQSYGETYYHAAYEIAKGTGVGSHLVKLDERKVDIILKKPWAQDGANFSDRIWSNKEKLVKQLHTELSQQIIRGEDPKTAISHLAHTMEVSQAQAGRLVMTESAAIAATAQKDCFQELEVEQFQIVAALDSVTCGICQEMDGKVFRMKEFEAGLTAPPYHPNCRCCEVPYFKDEFTEGEQRAAKEKEGKTYYVPADMKYSEWKETFVENGEQQEKKESVVNQEKNVIIKNRVSDELKKELECQLDALTEEEKSTITYYTRFGAQRINSAIAMKKGIDKVQDKINLLESALKKGVISQDITVIRKTIPEYLNYFQKGYKPTKEDMLLLKEKVLTNNIFTSTALEEIPLEKRDVIIYIRVPKGYKGALYIKSLAVEKYKFQEEVLFATGFQYIVRNVDYREGIYYMEADAIWMK